MRRRQIHFLVRERSTSRSAHKQSVRNNSTPMRSPNMQFYTHAESQHAMDPLTTQGKRNNIFLDF
jgi:hypothetical protein